MMNASFPKFHQEIYSLLIKQLLKASSCTNSNTQTHISPLIKFKSRNFYGTILH